MGAKLVRDRMGDIPWGDEDAKKYLRPVLDQVEHVYLLKAKLLEEVGEFLSAIDARNRNLVEEELGDVMSVLAGLGAVLEKEGLADLDSFDEAMEKKIEERGGFEEGLVFDFNHYTA